MKIALCIAVCVLGCPRGAGAAVSFVRASAQYEAARDPGRYHPVNLLDDDPRTVWCAPAPPDGDDPAVTIVFTRAQRIDRMVIRPAPGSGRVVSEVRVSDGNRVVAVRLGSTAAAEVLRRPLVGTTFTITVAGLGDRSPGATVPEEVVCLADTMLYLGHGAFGGGASPLRYDPRRERLVGDWNGGPFGAPEKKLVFSLDGTWDWTYTPLLGGASRRMAGEYRFRGDRLLMRQGEVGRWIDTRYRYRRVKVDTTQLGAPAGDYDAIVLGGALGKELAGEYTNARFE